MAYQLYIITLLVLRIVMIVDINYCLGIIQCLIYLRHPANNQIPNSVDTYADSIVYITKWNKQKFYGHTRKSRITTRRQNVQNNFQNMYIERLVPEKKTQAPCQAPASSMTRPPQNNWKKLLISNLVPKVLKMKINCCSGKQYKVATKN